MAKTSINNYDLLLSVYDEKDAPSWDSRIPPLTKDNFEKIKTILSADQYSQLRNVVFTDLVNRIITTEVVQTRVFNPFSWAHAGSFTLGDTVQEVTMDIIKAITFQGMHLDSNGRAPDQFALFKPTVGANYFSMNRNDVYPISTSDVELQAAFKDEGALYALISSRADIISKSNAVDEMIISKKALIDYAYNSTVPLNKEQFIVVPDITTAEYDDDGRKNIAKFTYMLKNVISNLVFPSRAFNASGLMCSIFPEDMILLLRNDISNIQEVQFLSSIFNTNYASINIPIVRFDNLGVDEHGKVLPIADNIIGVCMDRNLYKIRDYLNIQADSFNALGLYHNHFGHYQQMYSTSPNFGCIYFVKNMPDRIVSC